jgi:hypothetical protein
MFDNRFIIAENANRDLRTVGIRDGSILRFKKLTRRKKKSGPIRLRENEKQMYIII